MPTSTTPSTRRKTAPKPSVAQRQPATRKARKQASARPHAPGAMPGWAHLGASTATKQTSPPTGLAAVSTFQFALLVVAFAAIFVGYVGHVHATRATLEAAQEARDLNLLLHLKENRLKGEFDRLTGPAVITARARALGLEEAIASGATIHLPSQ